MQVRLVWYFYNSEVCRFSPANGPLMPALYRLDLIQISHQLVVRVGGLLGLPATKHSTVSANY